MIARNSRRRRSTAARMLINTSFMRWVALLVCGLLGCTTPNPRSCADGACTDPAFPFCDLDGALEGTPNTCVAVDCTPGAFVACRGDVELRCNTLGNNLDATQCEGVCAADEGCSETRVVSIVFETDRDGNSEIYRMNLDGSLQTNLTRHPASDALPRWSPSGDLVAFLSDRDGDFQLYVMEPDGASVRNVSAGSVSDFAWAPDSGRLAFISNRTGTDNLYTVGVDGGGLTPLTQTGGAAFPSWSPDGARIVYETTSSIAVVPATGGMPVPIGMAVDRRPAWSPDGATIAFGRRLTLTNFEIFVMAPDGTGARNLTNTSTETETETPVWSPDSSAVATLGGTDSNNEVVIIDVASGIVSNLSMAAGRDSDPCWTADSSEIVFTSTRDGQTELYKVARTGGNALRLTESAGDDRGCSIRPR